ncbi:unnamed protein product [Mytilus edulis]|uniref:Uncharacterized protein n=1 Tax=Mytilus edulis TaxID=6550 RepID=A0A8S3S187_MYTED|nr:unnamed protein product [Mytilus edulis]
MNDACRDENLLVVQWLVENVDNTLFDVKTALGALLARIKDDDDNTVMNEACSHGRLEVVKWLLENVDNTLFDVKTALDCAIGEDKEDDDDDDDDGDDDDDDDDDDDFDFDFKIIDLLLQRFKDEDVLSHITNLKRLMRVTCFNFEEDIINC